MKEEKTLSLNITDEMIESLKKLTEIKDNCKYTLRTNCLNGKAFEFDGYLKIDASKLFKRKRIGKKYKWFKTKSVSILDFTFQADNVREIRV